jgi:hypothetical protein
MIITGCLCKSGVSKAAEHRSVPFECGASEHTGILVPSFNFSRFGHEVF